MIRTVAGQIAGLHTASASPVFLAILAVHVIAALTAVSCGAMLALRRKGDQRHRRTGRIYTLALTAVATTTLALSAFDLGRDWPLDILGILAACLAWLGTAHRRLHRRGDTGHILAMSGSYVLMLTAFYVAVAGPAHPRLLAAAIRRRGTAHCPRNRPAPSCHASRSQPAMSRSAASPVSCATLASACAASRAGTLPVVMSTRARHEALLLRDRPVGHGLRYLDLLVVLLEEQRPLRRQQLLLHRHGRPRAQQEDRRPGSAHRCHLRRVGLQN